MMEYMSIMCQCNLQTVLNLSGFSFFFLKSIKVSFQNQQSFQILMSQTCNDTQPHQGNGSHIQNWCEWCSEQKHKASNRNTISHELYTTGTGAAGILTQ